MRYLYNMKKKVLVTGGAGYIGSILLRQLLTKGYYVRALDNLQFGGESIVDLLNHENFDFIKGDIRNNNDLTTALKGIDIVVNLAAIVGDPACKAQPDLAQETNFEAVKSIYSLSEKSGVERFIYASTCSNYGKSKNPEAYIDEKFELAPVSLYAKTKVASEEFLLSQSHQNKTKPTCLRFATAYGLSSRMRFDLTVNEFAKELAMGRELVIFGEQFWRPYCHIIDLARAIISVIEADIEKIAFNVFNVGDTRENYTKKMIADELIRQIPYAKVTYVKKVEDPRDYKVSFEKINEILGFKITKRVPGGIMDIIECIKDGFFQNPDAKKYKNS